MIPREIPKIFPGIHFVITLKNSTRVILVSPASIASKFRFNIFTNPAQGIFVYIHSEISSGTCLAHFDEISTGCHSQTSLEKLLLW